MNTDLLTRPAVATRVEADIAAYAKAKATRVEADIAAYAKAKAIRVEAASVPRGIAAALGVPLDQTTVLFGQPKVGPIRPETLTAQTITARLLGGIKIPRASLRAVDPADAGSDWQQYGLCRDAADWFTADSNTVSEVEQMRSICSACPVLMRCSAYVAKTIVAGFAAGLTQAERGGNRLSFEQSQIDDSDVVAAAVGPAVAAADGIGDLHKRGNGTARRRAEAVVDMATAGLTISDIARKLGCTTRSVNRLRRDARYRYRLDVPDRVPSVTANRAVAEALADDNGWTVGA